MSRRHLDEEVNEGSPLVHGEIVTVYRMTSDELRRAVNCRSRCSKNPITRGAGQISFLSVCLLRSPERTDL
ncbi:hypothetical protein J6590_062107 [Homalodisca vitripennis]|nr:hypothetical protein J6590_062107 [Homalodisca vitripennis]